MGAGDLSEFRRAGRALFSFGLVRESEGNLSTWDGERLLITRTGARLFDLGEDDVLEGTLEAPPTDASTDLERHLWVYQDRKGRAVVHCHPPGTIPAEWTEGQPHGLFTHGLTLDQAVASAVHLVRQGDLAPPGGDGMGSARMVRAVEFEDYRPLTTARDTDLERVFAHGALRVIDQTALPAEERHMLLGSPEEVADAIRSLAIRGAPLLGISAAYALVLAARESDALDREGLLADLARSGSALVRTRPTAVNIRWAVERVLARIRGQAGEVAALRSAVLEEARRIEAEDADACSAMGAFGAELVPDGANVLTHCNTGMLCTAGIGTALGAIHSAHLQGKRIHVWVDETRPAWQGARLTAWELQRLGIPFAIVADAAAGALIASGRVSLVVVGADRIAANGDVANKIGTYTLAVLAKRHGVPFYVVAPTSTFDLATSTGAEITIEDRDPAEVTAPLGLRVAPEGSAATNPAFDVTPAELVTAIVTERGIAGPPYPQSLAVLQPPPSPGSS